MGKRPSTVIVAAWLLLALLFASCSRNQPTPAANEESNAPAPAESAPAPKPLPANGEPIIVTFGDSLTAGVVPQNYPDYLQELLRKNGYPYEVDNQGVSGDTTSDGLARIDNVVNEHPALVILEFGGNDGLRGIPVDATRRNLDQMIARLTQAHIPIVLLGITLPPNYGPDYVKPFTAMFPELARKYDLKLMPFLLVHVYQNPSLMQPDGIHPSAAGNRIVAQDVFNLIKPMLHRNAGSPK